MKKVMVLLMMLFMMSSFIAADALASADLLDTGDVLYTGPYNEAFTTDIVPTVQLIDPGSIKVSISWSAPQLSFDKRMVKDTKGNDVRYYALKDPKTLVFSIENSSLSGTLFDGTIYVIPIYSRSKEDQSTNIRVVMDKQQKELIVVKGAVENSVSLQYMNVEDKDLDTVYPERLLRASASQQEIEDIMTAKVTFNISTTKKQ